LSILEAASTKRNTKNSFASAMEKLALMLALDFAHRCCFRDIVLEGDSAIVIKALKEKTKSFRIWGRMINQSRIILGNFWNVNVLSTKRCKNQVARLLAKQAQIDGTNIWMKIAFLTSVIF